MKIAKAHFATVFATLLTVADPARYVYKTIAFGIVLVAPLYANAATNDAAGVGAPASSNAGSAGIWCRRIPAMLGLRAVNMAPQPSNRSHHTDGLSRDKDDCARSGCIDEGGN
jgi:hypothetical protein